MQQWQRDELAKVECAHCDDFAAELWAWEKMNSQRAHWSTVLCVGITALIVAACVIGLWNTFVV